MSTHQIAKPHAHTPRIHVHVQALRLCQFDARHDARVTIAPAVVFGLALQPCTRLTPLETGAGVFAVCLRYRSTCLVAAGRIDFAGNNTHFGARFGVVGSGLIEGILVEGYGGRVVVLAENGPELLDVWGDGEDGYISLIEGLYIRTGRL